MNSKAKSKIRPPPRPQKAKQLSSPQPQQPASQRKKKRKQKSKTDMIGLPRSMGTLSVSYLDPLGKTDPPRSATSYGNFTTINGVWRSSAFVTNTVYDTYLLVQWNASDMGAFNWNDNGALDSPVTAQRIPQFSVDALQQKPLRMSVSIRNVTQMVNVAGLVRVLNMPQNYDWSAAFGGSPSSLSPATVANIKTLIDSSANTVTIALADTVNGKTWVNYPISSVGYNTWYKQYNADSIQGRLVESSFNETMSTILMHFPPTTTGSQQIEVVVRRQDGFRYAANSALSQTARPAPIGRLGEIEELSRRISHLNSNPIESVVHPVAAVREDFASRARQVLETGQRIASGASTIYNLGRAAATMAAFV